MQIIKKYKELSFENRTIFNTRFSIVFNAFMAIIKFILSIFLGFFFFVNGIVNVFIAISKIECYLGIKTNKKSFNFRNNMIAIFLMLSGLQYTFYMSRLLLTDVEVMKYHEIAGICIALVSFVEMGIAIKGLFNASGKGHFFRNIKLINLSSALTAIVLTAVSLTSFAAENDTRLINGIFGVIIGGVIILIGIFMLIAPIVSVVDKEHRIYKLIDNKESLFTSEKIEIRITNSKFYADYYYSGILNNDIIDGHIIKGKNPILKWNIYILILVFILSEILIFPYAVGAIVNYFKGYKLIKKLDSIMIKNNYMSQG